MRKILVFLILLSQIQTVFAATSCRDAVVEAYGSLGKEIERNSFSSTTYSELNISVQDFNLLPSEEQEEIYMKIKPIEVMVEEAISELNKKISRIAGSFYEFFMIDELQDWRSKRDSLRSCE
jgi:hypothetical protein